MNPQQSRIDTAVDFALAGATVIAANTRSARRLRFAAERRAFQTKSVCETPDILPLDAWISRTWTGCLLAGKLNRALIKPNVAAALWQEIVKNSTAGRELMNPIGSAQTASDAWRLIHAYKLPRNRAAFSATGESKAFYGWAESFEERCRQEGWIDSASALSMIVSLATQLPNPSRQIVTFGFDQFTPLQQDLWAALRAGGTEVVLLSPETPYPRESARAISFRDTKAEIRAAALWARRKLEEQPQTRIGIIVPGLEKLRDIIDTIFTECLHPERSLLTGPRGPRCFEISLGRPLAQHSITRTALRLLRLATSSLTAAEFSSLLRSRYVRAGASESNGRALLDCRLRKQLRATVTLSSLLKDFGEKGRALAPKFFFSLADLERNTRRFSKPITRSSWAAETRRLLSSAGWPGDGEQELTLNSEEFQATNAWDALLSDFGSLDLVLPPAPAAQLQRELEFAAQESVFAIENEGAPIQVVGPLAASGDGFDALWFCGLTDEAWPQRGQANPFVPYALQVQAGTPHSTPEINFHDAEHVLSRLLQSAEESILSWPQREDDRELRASPLLAQIQPVTVEELSLPAVTGWLDLQNNVAMEEFTDEQAPAIADEEVRMRATTLLEWQSGCPFRAFAQVRLAAEPLDEPTLSANPRDRGKITELALQYVWEQFRDLRNFQSLTREQIDHEVKSAIDRAVDDKFPKGDEEWLRRHRDLERERLAKLIRQWLELENKREPFHNVQHQQPIDAQIAGLTIKGRADRIEQTNDGAYVVIDYKTGGSAYSPAWWDVPRPKEPQLPIYAVTQRSQGHEIAGVAFARVKAGNCEFKGEAARKEILAKPQNDRRYAAFQSIIDTWQPELERLAGDFLSGHAEVDPKRPPTGSNSTCTYCHLTSLCRIAEFAKPTDDDDLEATDEEE